MSTAKGGTSFQDGLFQSSKINIGDKVYITQKGDGQVLSNHYNYLDHLTVKTKDVGQGRFAESGCTYGITADDGDSWTAIQEDFDEGMLATYAMLSPSDKMELWRREGIDIRDDQCDMIPFDEECGDHITNWSKAEAHKQEMIEEEMEKGDCGDKSEDEYTGGSVNYYKLHIKNPTTEGFAPYTCECNDVIEELGMNYAEGNAFKALWRRAAARKGIKKKGYDGGMYDAEKVKFFGERLIVQSLEGDE